jgi:leucyl-tRNA synthetase
MKRYDPKSIEPKWQQIWDEKHAFEAEDLSDRPKTYISPMFPYPSGAGMHTGHTFEHAIVDAIARFYRANGHNVLNPMGWDSFGLPAENYAIKTGTPPQETTKTNIANFKNQLKRLGASIDWTREINTSDPEYYKWTQWIFTKFFERGLAYQKESLQWWCEIDQTVLANEQVVNGKCWRHDGPDDPLAVKKSINQWFFKITDYADALLEEIPALDWPEKIKTAQTNWIGKSQGAEIRFDIDSDLSGKEFLFLHAFKDNSKSVFWPWLKQELESKGAQVTLIDLPNPDNPNLVEQLEYVKNNYTFTPNTSIITHSLGGVLALKLLPDLNCEIEQLVLAGTPLRTDDFKDGVVRQPLSDYCDWQFDFAAVKRKVGEIKVLSSKNDHIVPESHAAEIAKAFGVDYVAIETSEPHFNGLQETSVLNAITPSLDVFTTRPDTIFGATFLVLAPEHPLAKRMATDEQREEVESYIANAVKKSEIDRLNDTKEKTGVFTGSYAVNPANGERIPVWIADYVLWGYGTGAIMAVPAHDERDYAFAKKFNLAIIPVIEAEFGNDQDDEIQKQSIIAVVRDPKTSKVLVLDWGERKGNTGGKMFIGGGIEGDEDPVDAAMREVTEETGYANIKYIADADVWVNNHFYSNVKNKAIAVRFKPVLFELIDDTQVERNLDDNEDQFTVTWVDEKNLADVIEEPAHFHGYELLTQELPYKKEGVMVNSGEFDGTSSSDMREQVVAWLEQQGVGKTKTTYKMRDWLISRQRYWGAPIPIIHCESHGAVPVPEEQLPVILPETSDFAPKGDGKSALARVEDWVNTTCPTCGKPAQRETDTMDGYACSSWYLLRYTDPQNDEQAWKPELANYWAPVDFYVGGDHAVAHLLYVRFWTHVFRDMGLVDFKEPVKKLVYHGLISAEDGRKMSKSLGNTVDPLEIIDQGYGADALRTYELFLGPIDENSNWSSTGIAGVYRFINRVWTLVQEYDESDKTFTGNDAAVARSQHKTTRKVTDDIRRLSFNTAIAALMEYVNELYKLKVYGFSEAPWHDALSTLVQLAAPFAPHVAEELWQQLGHEGLVQETMWPAWDESLIVDDTMTIIVQVNGKLRAKLDVPTDTPKEEIEKLALANDHVQTFVEGKDPAKIIYVPGKILNIVVR